MPLRPPIVRPRRAPATTATTPPPSDDPVARVVRPRPERSFPLRTASHLLRDEPGHAPPNPSTAGDVLGPAYRVIDDFLREGREYAAGQSAWYNQATGGSSGATPPDDLVRAMAWIFDQLGRRGRPASAPQARPPQAPTWPQPRWQAPAAFHPQQDPRYDAPSPSHPPAAAQHDWEDWDFEDSPAQPAHAREDARPHTKVPPTEGTTPALHGLDHHVFLQRR